MHDQGVDEQEVRQQSHRPPDQHHTTAADLLCLVESPSDSLLAISPSPPLTPLNFITRAQN